MASSEGKSPLKILFLDPRQAAPYVNLSKFRRRQYATSLDGHGVDLAMNRITRLRKGGFSNHHSLQRYPPLCDLFRLYFGTREKRLEKRELVREIPLIRYSKALSWSYTCTINLFLHNYILPAAYVYMTYSGALRP